MTTQNDKPQAKLQRPSRGARAGWAFAVFWAVELSGLFFTALFEPLGLIVMALGPIAAVLAYAGALSYYYNPIEQSRHEGIRDYDN